MTGIEGKSLEELALRVRELREVVRKFNEEYKYDSFRPPARVIEVRNARAEIKYLLKAIRDCQLKLF